MNTWTRRAAEVGLLAAVALATCALARPARAQCGAICIYEVGTPHMGSSYAGAGAVAQTAATAYLNPAGMTHLEQAEILGGAYVALLSLEFDSGSGTVPPPGGFTNDGGEAGGFLPGVGSYAVLPVTDDLSAGMAVNGLFGGSLDYLGGWVARTFITEVELLILNFQPGLGYRLTDELSVGASLNVLKAELSKFRLRASPLPGAQTLRADGASDWETSFTVGLLYEPRDGTRIGLTYRDRADMNLEGGDAANFEYEFELARGANLSVFHQLTEQLALLFDTGWSDWSEFSQQQIVVGPADVSFDRHWHDTWRFAVGAQYAPREAWLLQAGFGFDTSPVSDSHRTPDLPYSEQYRFSLGVQHDYRENLTVGMTYTFLWFGHPEIDTKALPPSLWGVVLDGKYDDSWGQFVGFTIEWRFCSPFPWAECPSTPAPDGDTT